MNNDTNFFKLQYLPVNKGRHYDKYLPALERVKKARRPELESVEVYAWHGCSGEAANSISKEGFDANRIGKKFGKQTATVFVPVCYLAFECVGFEIQHGPFPYNLGK